MLYMEYVWLSLGSNLSKPQQQLNRALYSLLNLPHTSLVACSSYYRSNPLLGYYSQKQPNFINAVAILYTNLNPEYLLQCLHHIEFIQGRQRSISHKWGPRTLDLDILLVGNCTIATSSLIVPHYDMFNREFVLYPLAELSPNLRFPDGSIINDYLLKVPRNGLELCNYSHTIITNN